MLHHKLFPVFCISALNDVGSGRLMGFIDNVAPSTADLKPEQSVDGKEIPFKKEAPTVLFVFKTVHQSNLGQLTFFKVMSG
jgi:elongation factor G